MAQRRVMGTSLPKVDGPDKVTGRSRFGADLKLPGMLYGKILRSPYAHARIKSIDTSKAGALPGVEAVITASDFPAIKPGTMAPFGEEGSVDIHHLSHLLMARDKVLFSGHPVAAVAARSKETAEEALDLIQVEYEVLPPVLDVEKAMEPDAPLLHEDMFTRSLGDEQPTSPSNVALHLEMGRGDVERGFAEADVVLEHTYRTQRVHQGYIEPESDMAFVAPDGHITVWVDSQGSFSQRGQLSVMLQIPAGRFTIVPMEIGGGFGAKSRLRLSPLCVVLSQKSGRPVRITLTREEVLRATGPGAPTVTWLKTGATRDGKLTAIQARIVYDAGSCPGAPLAGGMLAGFAAYKVDNLKIDGYDVVTSKPKVQAYRAPGTTQVAFAVESQMDAMAQALGIDPLELRARNVPHEGEPMPNDMPLPRIGLKEVLERVKEHPAWTEPLEGPNRGRGLAVAFWRGGTNTSSCHVTINGDGSINLMVGSVDLSATRTTMLQVAAEEFGVDPTEVRVTTGDTNSVAHTDGSGGSRITYTMSAAVHKACQDALSKLKNLAAERLRVPPEQVEYRERNFYARDIQDKRVTLAELGMANIRGAGAIQGYGTVSRMKHAPATAAHIADVEVDPETGKVTLLRYTTFQDTGFAINPAQVQGQMQGGATQGIGWALLEEYCFDEQGVMRNASLLDYRMPTALDLPMIGTEIIEVPSSDSPYGVRGVGEVPIVPPPAAIANAIARATGVRLRQLPMNPERVFWALRKAKAGGSP